MLLTFVLPSFVLGGLISFICLLFLAPIYVMNTTQLTGLDISQQKLVGTTGPDARRMRKAVFRRTIDYNASIMNYLKNRVWQFSPRSAVALQPDYLYNYLVNLVLSRRLLLIGSLNVTF